MLSQLANRRQRLPPAEVLQPCEIGGSTLERLLEGVPASATPELLVQPVELRMFVPRWDDVLSLNGAQRSILVARSGSFAGKLEYFGCQLLEVILHNPLKVPRIRLTMEPFPRKPLRIFFSSPLHIYSTVKQLEDLAALASPIISYARCN
eukprot:598425-Hanusia_phi.AAC.1